MRLLVDIFRLCLLVATFGVISSSPAQSGQGQSGPEQNGALYIAQQMQLESLRDELASQREDLSGIEKNETQLKLLEEVLKRETEALSRKISESDQRLNDHVTYAGQGVDRLGVYASILGILITLMLAGLSLIGYFTVAGRARAEAKIEAHKEAGLVAQSTSRKWFDDKARELRNRIIELEEQTEDVKAHFVKCLEDVDQHSEVVKTAMTDLQLKMGGMKSSAPTSPSSVEVVLNRAEELKRISVDKYSFDDWNAMGHAAFSKKEYEEAAFYWFKASQCEHSTESNIALSLFNRALAQGRLGLLDASISTYDDVIERFSGAESPMLKLMVAKSLVNKAGQQHKLGLSENGMDATYQELIEFFSKETDVQLKEAVGHAHNGIGFTLLCKGKKKLVDNNVNEAHHCFEEALNRFEKALQYFTPETINGITLGNKAYALMLIGNSDLAETLFAKALRAPVDGGLELYEETLSDLDVYPVKQDSSMREMVERQWQLLMQ